MNKTIVFILSAIILLSACEKKKDRLTNNTFTMGIDPAVTQTLNAGGIVSLKVVRLNSNLNNIDINPVWSVDSNLGSFNPKTGISTVFTAGNNSGSGKIYATYNSVVAQVGLNIASYFIYDDAFNSDLSSPGTFSDAYPLILSEDSANTSQGSKSFKTVFRIGGVGWAGWSVSEIGVKDMSAYSSGYLKFDIMTAYDIQIGIRSNNVNSNTNSAKKFISSYITLGSGTSFQSVSIPISDLTTAAPTTDLSQMKDMFIATALGSQIGAQTNQTYIIDNIRWTTN